MGDENSKEEKPKEDIYSAILKLKMSSKRFMRESRKAEKQKAKNMKKAEKCMLKGDEEGARLYVANAQDNINDFKKYRLMGNKLDVIADTIKSNKNSAEIMNSLSKNVTPILQQEAESMDIRDMMIGMNKFSEAFDTMEVNGNIVNQNLNKMTADGNSVKDTEDLLQQLKNKVQLDLGKDMDTTPVLEDSNKNKQKQVNNNQKDEAIDNYMEDLKNF